jgi:hypothetical protein
MAEVIKRVLGTIVGVDAGEIGAFQLDRDRNGYVERDEVTAEQWQAVLASAQAAVARRTNGLSHIFGPIRDIARYGTPTLMLPKASGVPVVGASMAISAMDEVFGAYGRGESLLNPLTLLNKIATIAYEGASSLLAGVAGSAAGVATSAVLTPAGGTVVGVTAAIGTKAGLDWVKDQAVYTAYELSRPASPVGSR